jgi:hypothetical protein
MPSPIQLPPGSNPTQTANPLKTRCARNRIRLSNKGADTVEQAPEERRTGPEELGDGERDMSH